MDGENPGICTAAKKYPVAPQMSFPATGCIDGYVSVAKQMSIRAAYLQTSLHWREMAVRRVSSVAHGPNARGWMIWMVCSR